MGIEINDSHKGKKPTGKPHPHVTGQKVVAVPITASDAGHRAQLAKEAEAEAKAFADAEAKAKADEAAAAEATKADAQPAPKRAEK